MVVCFGTREEHMIRRLLKDLPEWVTELVVWPVVGVVAIVLLALLFLPLVWLEHHHNDAFWTIVIISVGMNIWMLARALETRTCPYCGKKTFLRL